MSGVRREFVRYTSLNVLGMIALRETTRKLLDCQLHDGSDKPSVLSQFHAKQAERSAEPQKFQKRKSHNMEL